MNNNISYREVINEKGKIIVSPVGISMLPLIRQEKDTVLLSKITEPLKKYDVILYQRPDGKYVLHRIIKVRKNSYDLCGDNQAIIEHGVLDSWIIAKMEGFYKEEEFIPITNEKYIKYSKKRVRSRIFRYIRWFIGACFRKVFKRKK